MTMSSSNEDSQQQEPAQVVICGGGIVGLVLALALQKHVGLTAELYEQAPAFCDDVGAGMGMYPNGLRVIRDLSPRLLQTIREQGHAYLVRKWERHDGTQVAVAEENVLAEHEEELETIGIRRWRLQKVLYDAVVEAGIPIYFGKRNCGVRMTRDDGLVEIMFEDGTRRDTEILFGADGTKSVVRQSVAGDSSQLTYTGVTCVMGMADLDQPVARGICFPSASTTKCHGCFFPTKETEQCFQFHFPIPAQEGGNQGSWGTLSERVAEEECHNLAERLRKDGWDEKYLTPLSRVTHAVRVGFCELKPGLKKLVYGGDRGHIVLLGDAAHPPVPYIGQGAQMGLEDAGVIATLLKSTCLNDSGEFDVANFGLAMKIYEKMRIPRTGEILEKSKYMGHMQQKRAENAKYDGVKEELINRQIFFHENLPIMFPAATYDYKQDVANVLEKEPVLLPVTREVEEEEEN